MGASGARLVLPYRDAAEDRRAAVNEGWERLADVIVPVAFWSAFALVVAVFLGAVVLWGVLISLAA